MRAIVQRVSCGTVSVSGREVGRCGYGLLLLVGVHKEDDESDAAKLADKISNLRIFADEAGKMNLSLLDFPAMGGYEYDVLAISNFTVFGETRKSRRPSFVDSAPYEQAEGIFTLFVSKLRSIGISAQTGTFGAQMSVALVNEGPVTVIVDTR